MIANLYLEVGETDRAFQLVNSLDNSDSRFNLLAKVAKQYAVAGESEKANNIFAQTLNIAQTKNNAYQKASALYIIAIAYKDLRQYEKASEIITQASLTVKTAQQEKDILPVDNKIKTYDDIFSIFYPTYNNPLSQTRSNVNSQKYVLINDLLFQIDRFISELNLHNQYHPKSSFNHNLQSLIAESKYEKALELVQQSQASLLIDLINRPSSLLAYTPEYFEQLKAHPTPPPLKIDQIRKIAKEHQATLVEYTIVHKDNQSENVAQNSESELFIWVVKPTGEVIFRHVNLSFLGQPNIWLAQLASNPQLFVRGLMQELKMNIQTIHPAFIAIITSSIIIVICIFIWCLRLLFKQKAIFNHRSIFYQKANENKTSYQKEIIFLYSYTSEKSLFPHRLWRNWLLLVLILGGSGGFFLFQYIFRQQILANPYSEITTSRDKSLPQNQNQQPNNQADNSLLANLVSDSRESIGVRGRGLGLVPKVEKTKQTSHLQQLYQLLIEPIADLLPKDPSNSVIFIPTQSLFFVPFPALQDKEGKYLIQKHTILTAPSIQVLDLARQRKQKIGSSVLTVLNY
ncbi:CHAT domain-containing protein [Phormidium sp. LEGE 05292]|nr:CHAT domain-containing protein [Phormidium sp. LEGE 05292]